MNGDSLPLLGPASQGDPAALERLLAMHQGPLRAFVRLRVGPALRARESASDIVQSAVREVLQHLDRFQGNGEAGFRAWLYATALRKIADRADYWGAQKRDAAREVRLDAATDSEGDLAAVYESLASPSLMAAGRETLERLERAMDGLGDEQREVIVLSRIAGLSHAELGERLGCSEATARQRVFRALATLAQRMGGASGSRSPGS